MTIKDNLYELLDNFPESVLSGWDLFDLMYFRTGAKTYPSNLIKYAKEYCDASGGSFECINRAKSMYRYVPGLKIAGALKGKE